jgi:hypothetical protein
MVRYWLVAAALLGLAVATARAQYPGGDRAEMLVTNWYNRYLGRNPDWGASGWMEQLRRGKSPQEVLAAILGSDEYYNWGGRTPQGFIQKLFQDVVGRPPSPQEAQSLLRQAWRGRRSDVAYQLLLRYPQGWEGGATSYYPPYRRDYNTWPRVDRYHTPYDYRRPWYREPDR